MRTWSRHRHTVTVQILPYQWDGEDERGDAVKSYGAPIAISGVVFALGSGNETEEATRDRLDVSSRLFLPVGTHISAYDRVITADGLEWEVDGAPSVWECNPFTGSPGGIEVHLNRRIG